MRLENQDVIRPGEVTILDGSPHLEAFVGEVRKWILTVRERGLFHDVTPPFLYCRHDENTSQSDRAGPSLAFGAFSPRCMGEHGHQIVHHRKNVRLGQEDIVGRGEAAILDGSPQIKTFTGKVAQAIHRLHV
jgi:hypothetical protein